MIRVVTKISHYACLLSLTKYQRMFSVNTYSKCCLHGIDCIEQLYGNCVGCFIFFFKLTAKMFSCQACGHNCATVLAYVRHMRIHKNTPNLIFKCVLPDCSRSFLRFRAFRCHIYRHGKSGVKPRLFHEVQCHVDFCREKCKNLKSFYSHLKIHIREGKTVACPYRHCDKSCILTWVSIVLH